MKNRRSIRHFYSKKIPEKTLQRILKAGQYAPSGANKHPYSYIIIEDQMIKKDIKKHCEIVDKKFYKNSETWFKNWMKKKGISLKKDFLVEAPVLIVVTGEMDKPYWLESTWISITYVILAAEYEGLGTLTYTPSEIGFLKEILMLPEKIEPVVIIPIGYYKK
jgi:nitroreductase